ncbi:MAG TPA: hypothetical protein VLG27_03140 [Candidatus Saccharimonadia bacterium]|nr:hypothetical protein [Candidatus Saccharimonadia bacterium]
MYKFVIAKLRDGNVIYVNFISSSAGHYLSRQPYVIALVKELLTAKKLRGERIVIEQDMGRTIGKTDIVATSEKDIIYYARPVKSDVFSRFAKNRYPQSSNKLTIIVVQDTDGNYEVSDAWIGPNCPAFPGDEYETIESKEYWQSHALVQDAQAIQSRSITKTCPY